MAGLEMNDGTTDAILVMSNKKLCNGWGVFWIKAGIPNKVEPCLGCKDCKNSKEARRAAEWAKKAFDDTES